MKISKKIEHIKTEDIVLFSLVYNCPFCYWLNDCPFKPVEKLLFRQKVLWVKGLSKEEKSTILKHHESCFIKR